MQGREPDVKCLKCGSPMANSESGGYCAKCLISGLISITMPQAEAKRRSDAKGGRERGRIGGGSEAVN
jgi:hypothetical protein